MKVTVNKCPHTGRLIECDKEYRRHMRIQVQERKEDLERMEFAKQFNEWIQPLYLLRTFEEIETWLDDNYMIVARNYGYRCSRYWHNKPYRKPTKDDRVKFSFGPMKFDEKIPTGRAAPRGQFSDCRGGYNEFGWRGRITATHHGDGYAFFDHDHLSKIGIHTGSGGGSPTSSSYDVYLFAKDFKGLARTQTYLKLQSEASRY